jgi:glycosyltransferase involved in cell wall biosynthesis
MRILFTRFPYESAHGGAEMQTISLMKELKKRGHSVAFLGSCPTLLVMCEQFNILPMELHIGRPPVSKWTLLLFFFQRWRRKKTLEDAFQQFFTHGLEVICMLSLTEKLLLTPHAVRTGMKVVWIEHDSIGHWLTWNPFFFQLRKLSALVTTVTVSQLSRQKYIDFGWNPDRVLSVPNGVDTQRFTTVGRGAKRDTSKPFQIGVVARLDYEKGLDILIKAMKNLPRAELTIIGVGKQERSLTELIEDEALAARVKIVRRLGKLGDFYQKLHLLVLPSRTHDPFGLVVPEAMCMGVPVVVTDVCGVAMELESGKNAVIVPAGSSSALQEAIATLMNDDTLRTAIGKAGMKKAHKDFTIPSMVDQYESLFKV